MTYIIYFCVTFIATFIGAIAGLGGGLIIKPVLDFLNDYDIATIGMLSTFAVMTMSTVSIFKNRKSLNKLQPQLLLTLAISAFAGGIIGDVLFNGLLSIADENVVGSIQSFLLIVILIVVVILNMLHSKIYLDINPGLFLSIFCGLFLGILGSFLGIGGGPLNILVLIILFHFTPIEAAIGSVFIIFFAQISVILKTLITTGFSQYDLSMLVVMLPAAVIGGYLGSNILKKSNPNTVSLIFNVTIFGVILINIYNLFT